MTLLINDRYCSRTHFLTYNLKSPDFKKYKQKIIVRNQIIMFDKTFDYWFYRFW